MNNDFAIKRLLSNRFLSFALHYLFSLQGSCSHSYMPVLFENNAIFALVLVLSVLLLLSGTAFYAHLHRGLNSGRAVIIESLVGSLQYYFSSNLCSSCPYGPALFLVNLSSSTSAGYFYPVKACPGTDTSFQDGSIFCYSVPKRSLVACRDT